MEENTENNQSMLVGLIVVVVLVALGVGAYVYSQNQATEDDSMDTSEQVENEVDEEEEEALNIVETASETDDVSTLVTAVQAADLVETLSSEGPFTVFAPTNAAFDALPEGTLDTLLEPDNQADLADVLTYHVVEGEFTAAEVLELDGEQIETVNGELLTVIIDGDTVTLQGGSEDNVATVAIADVVTSNGVIHIIDTVLLP